MNLQQTVFIRADAGSSIGIGHIRRCAVLAAEIAKNGANVTLLTRRQPNVAERDLSWPHKLCWLNGRLQAPFSAAPYGNEEESDAKQTIEAIERLSRARSWVILDSGRFGYRWEAIVRSGGHPLLVIEDCRVRKHCADIVVSDSQAPVDQLPIGSKAACRQLYGRQYALVDSRFFPSCELGQSAVRRAKNVLISYGGSDPTSETGKAIEALVSLQGAGSAGCRLGRVDLVIGPLNKRAPAIAAAAQQMRGAVIHRAPACLAPLMRDADIYLTAGGNSLIEPLVMRKRCIVTMTAKNQEATVHELSEEGSIVFLGRHTDVAPEHVASAIAEALRGRQTRGGEIRPEAGYDQFGARRIVQEMSRYSLYSGMNAVGCSDP